MARRLASVALLSACAFVGPQRLRPRGALRAEPQELSELRSWMHRQGGELSGVDFVDLEGFKYSLVADKATSFLALL